MSAFQLPLWISALLSLFYFSSDDKHLPSPPAKVLAVQGVCEEDEEEKFHKPLLTKKLVPPPDTLPPQNPNNHQGDATHNPQAPSPLFAPNPTNVVVTYELSGDGKGYYIFERVGGVDIKPPSFISFDDYIKYRREKLLFENSKEYSLQNNKEIKKGLIPTFDLGAVNDIFGGGPIEIKPTGMFSLNFAINTNKNKNPILSIRQQNNTYFDFDQQIQVGVNGQIGNKMKLNINQDTKATFDFENLLKLDYSGDEDQIIQRLSSGNISMQTGNSLIQGSQNLFGLKAELKLGPVNITGLGSLQRGQKQTINVKSGAIETPFRKPATDYDANRHFFLSHYFRSKYDDALSRLPQIKSDIRINQVEVWVSNPNVNQTTGLRPAIGFIDMGENNLPVANGNGVLFNTTAVQANPSKRYPDKQANNLYSRLVSDPNIRVNGQSVPILEGMGMTNGVDFQMVNLRKLQETKDYTLQGQLGYISLNSPLQSDDVLFVSFSYTIDGKPYQVGEFSNDIPSNANNNNPLFLKMLRPSQFRPTYNGKRYPVWDLMMKNIYSIAYGLSSNNFKLQIMYESGKQGKLAFLPTSAVANRPLIQVTNIDQLTNNTAPTPDNLFDYIEGLTILSDKGYIMFPVLEPFGNHLAKQIKNSDDSARYVYQPLYDMTYQDAITLHNQLNKYTIEGTYQGANNSEIPLNSFNVSPQSVTVTANGVRLTQGTDYEVDAAAGKVIIKNPAYMAPGQDIKVDVEQQQMYQMQTRTLAGLRAEMNLTDNIKIGAAMMHLNERPTTFKVTLGDEPLSNTIWGIDLNGQRESKFLTKMIDKLPFISTKAPSNITFSGELAHFIPGQPRQLKANGENGIIYLDDFEAAKQPYDLTGPANWKLASFPRYQPDTRLYDPSVNFTDKNAKNFSRAKLAWYRIDPQIYNNDVVNIVPADRTYSYTRPVSPTEIFPTATIPVGSGFQSTLDLHYFPAERGSYNYQYDIGKVGADGRFLFPEENWAGVMADIKMNTDFEAANVEFIEFWMMDPFMDGFASHTGGQMYLNIGNISEDVLPDNLQSFENALPLNDSADEVTVTDWARVPNTIPPSNSFSNGADDRQYQDVGLDGMRDQLERQYFQPYLDKIAQNFGTSSAIYTEMSADPSTDNYTHHLANGDQQISILQRFKTAYGTEGNSKLGETTSNGLTLQGTPYPDMEDLNRNGTPNTWEEYFEYRLDLNKTALIPGQNYIIDSVTTIIRDQRGNPQDTVTWFQVRIPIKSGKAVNNIPNFKVINFMRMYMTGFQQEAIVRITDLQLVSTQWRRYVGPNFDPPFPSGQAPEPPFSVMDVGSVSLQDNSKKEPFNYQMPPGILRQGINGNTSQNLLMDERSLSLRLCGLKDGESQGVFKNVVQDLRNYKNLRMWVHAEAVNGVDGNFNQTGDASIFVRLGLDNDYNYYEYEMPLKPSDPALGQEESNIWANAIDFALIRLTEAKQARNDANFSFGDRFTYTAGLPAGHKIYVKGTAKLSDVRSVFIGVRNPHGPTQGDVCLEVWLNELRLTDFDQESSWAANANVNITLADIGMIQASLQYRQAGFGPLEQKLSQKGREDNLRYTLAGDFSIGKFFPQKWGINLPVHINYDEQFRNPVFDPREADVKTKDLTKNMTRAEKDQALFEILDYTRNKGISLMNVKKNKTGTSKKSLPWDISNFDASFAFSEQYGHNYLTETRYASNHKGGLNYRYSIKSPNIQPFKKWKKKNPISDFNFSPLPNQVSISLLGDRQFTENKLRSTPFSGESDPVYTKNFVLSRNYTMAWDLTKNLKLNFNASNQARVDEVKGYWRDATQAQKDSVAPLFDNLIHFGRDTSLNQKFDKMIYSGRTIGYNHNINLQYNLPLKNYKWTDWINGTGTYTATFNWMNPPEAYPGLGATISNTR
ncbi:MAG: cell surface protein SprA, partial [Bacteroidia bacterium]